MKFKIGDFVTRSSYNSDIIFKIVKIESDDKVILRSYKFRLMADAPLDDLIKYKKSSREKLKKNLLMRSYQHLKRKKRELILNGDSFLRKNNKSSCQEIPGNVLHIDGDRDYFEICMQNYDTLQIEAKGFFIPEKEQPASVSRHLKKYKPDILVLTGHDGNLNTEKGTRTSKYFEQSVKIARNYESDLDELIIFAGACQSDYYKLIEEGANFASAPEKKFIHFLDPVLVAEKIAYTSIKKIISVKDIVNSTMKKETIGGIETRGKLRKRYP